MACEYKMTHRVEFAETDMAGIIHFSSFFRYMEVTEHAFLRSLGFSVHWKHDGRLVGWPRVHVSCDFLRPLRFEDEVEAQLLVQEKRSKSLTYRFLFRTCEEDAPIVVAHGRVTVVCVTADPETGRMKAIAIPVELADCIEEAPASLLDAK